MKKYYFDFDRDILYTEAELKAEYEQLVKDNETDSETFERYLYLCMASQNGSLERYSEMLFTDYDSMKAHIIDLISDEDMECYVWQYDDKRFIDSYNKTVYEAV